MSIGKVSMVAIFESGYRLMHMLANQNVQAFEESG
jgi:hypothetical protein